MNSDRLTRAVLFSSSLLIIIIAAGIVFSLAGGSVPAFREFGLGFITNNRWNPTAGREVYGALPFIAGTLITSFLALLICIPFAFSTSLFIAEYFRGTRVAGVLSSMIDLLAGIPSIVYGLWGFYMLRPLLTALGVSSQGFGIFTSSLVLAIMIIPYATSISSEIMAMVPDDLKEAAYSLGATRIEVIFNVIIPNAGSGIIAGFILALGRAIGETMAVTMLIGNSNTVPSGIFDTGNTMASVIANQFGEATGLKLSSLIAVGLILFAITGIVNAAGKYIIKKFSGR
ncbi:MAG TPA: phosphate ABC transporter permease subunit PstC [Bacteroidales bacterium]|jgi:phosphate transport system permease protein|nr:phosphate ABC transporter permease subunit PstC [Bacteroidales bacterium]